MFMSFNYKSISTSGVLEHKMASEPNTTPLLNVWFLTSNIQATNKKSSFFSLGYS